MNTDQVEKGEAWILRGKKNLSTFVQGPKINVKQTANDTGETTNSTTSWSKRYMYGIKGRKIEMADWSRR